MENIIATINFTSVLWQIAIPLIFSLGDVISGFIQAIINNDIDSKVMRAGLLHKILLILIIILSFVLHYGLGWSWLSKAVCVYIIIMESVSILENLKKAGINIGKLTEYLKEKTEYTTPESINKLTDVIENKKEGE